MFTHSTSKAPEEHVNRIVKSILNKRQRNVIDQQKTFIRRNTDENNKRNNYLVDKFTMKKPTRFGRSRTELNHHRLAFSSTKENVPVSPKKKALLEDDDDDFISTKKRPRLKEESPMIQIDPIRACLEAIIAQIEQDDATCPICNQVLMNLTTLDQREQHVNRCLEEMQINHVGREPHMHCSDGADLLSTRSKASSRNLSSPIQSSPPLAPVENLP